MTPRPTRTLRHTGGGRTLWTLWCCRRSSWTAPRAAANRVTRLCGDRVLLGLAAEASGRLSSRSGWSDTVLFQAVPLHVSTRRSVFGRCTGNDITLADITVHGYPQLPAINLQSRSPYGWWDQQERKNFDEVVSISGRPAKSGVSGSSGYNRTDQGPEAV